MAFMVSAFILMAIMVRVSVSGQRLATTIIDGFDRIAMTATVMNGNEHTRGKDSVNSQYQEGYYCVDFIFHHYFFRWQK